MASKSFDIAAEDAVRDEDEVEIIEFNLVLADGSSEPFEAMRPTEGQLALFASAFGEDAEEMGAMGAVMGFYKAILVGDGYRRIRDLLSDPTTGVGPKTLQGVIKRLVTAFTGNPTEPSSASTPTPAKTGQRSTAPAQRRASTRSPSRRTGSTT